MARKMQKQRVVKFGLAAAILTLFILGTFIVNYYFEYKNSGRHTVTLTAEGFSPSDLTIYKGDFVEFKTDGTDLFWPASDPHPIHDNYSGFDPKEPIEAGESYTFRFTKTGEWHYHDHLFPYYRGKIIVLEKKKASFKENKPNRGEIKQLVDKKGAMGAYLNLKKRYAGKFDASAHTAMHLFGEVLYDSAGVDGIGVCDDSFGFGCYHGFFIRAVSDRGLGVVSELDQKCVERFGELGLGCVHGIGHGIGEFFSHQKIEEQLAICGGLTWKGEFFGCAGGVFMENNFQTEFAENESSVKIREVVNSNLHEPCDKIPENFSSACYFEQAAWWDRVMESDYKKIGELCASTDSTSNKDACFLGLGNAIAESTSYSQEYKVACRLMPDEYSEAICRTGAAWAFFADPNKRNKSVGACADLGRYQNLCLEKRILVK
jgi:plastocyanin